MTLAKLTCTFQPALLSSTAFDKMTLSTRFVTMTLAIMAFSLTAINTLTFSFQPLLLSATAFGKMALSTKTHAKKTLSIMTLGTTFVTMTLTIMAFSFTTLHILAYAFQPSLLGAMTFAKMTLSIMNNDTCYNGIQLYGNLYTVLHLSIIIVWRYNILQNDTQHNETSLTEQVSMM
jgi:hypothetical protein